MSAREKQKNSPLSLTKIAYCRQFCYGVFSDGRELLRIDGRKDVLQGAHRYGGPTSSDKIATFAAMGHHF